MDVKKKNYQWNEIHNSLFCISAVYHILLSFANPDLEVSRAKIQYYNHQLEQYTTVLKAFCIVIPLLY